VPLAPLSCGCRAAASGAAALAPDPEAREASLHDQMRDMMSDADDDDDGLDGASKGDKFLQVSGRARAEDASGLRDSAAALDEALGPQWNGAELEADAKRKTNALLEGIAGHKAFGTLNNMLNMLR